jgi:hypothetical protein
MITTWNVSTYHYDNPPSTTNAIDLLRNDSAAVVVIKDAIAPELFHKLAAEVSRRRDQAAVSNYSNGSLTTFGPYLARHLSEPSYYFEAAHSTDELFAAQPGDLRLAVRQSLRDFLGLHSLEVAREADQRQYAPAVIRIHSDGIGNPLHNDNIMRDAAASGLLLSRLRYQFSCITCLQECDANGELVHYRRRWTPEHEVFKLKGGLGYHEGVVDGAEVCQFRPSTGDIYIIDPTNFHAIRAVSGSDRITLGFFFGFFDEECRDGVCWS